MSYKDTLDFLFNQLANYHKSGGSAYKPGLERIRTILKQLGNPHSKFKSIHVAGTNGKGSVSHMLASVLQEAGYKTGLFTSPHLIDFKERIKINGLAIPETHVVSFVNEHRDEFTILNASFFEWTWAMACDYFSHQNVDFVVVEVGLGGRLDATNSIQPELSIITSIGLDHVAMLGNSIEAIAREKGGIIKPNTPVVIGDVPTSAMIELERIAEKNNSSVLQRKHQKIETDLEGQWQVHNAQLALSASELLNIQNDVAVNGLKRVQKNTGLLGRLQLIQKAPKIYCDTAHNLDSWKVLIKHFMHIDLHLILGFVNDKEIDTIVNILPSNWLFYVCEPKTVRAKPKEELAKLLRQSNLKVDVFDDIQSAYQKAKEDLSDDDILLVSGSNYLIGDLLKII